MKKDKNKTKPKQKPGSPYVQTKPEHSVAIYASMLQAQMASLAARVGSLTDFSSVTFEKSTSQCLCILLWLP